MRTNKFFLVVAADFFYISSHGLNLYKFLVVIADFFVFGSHGANLLNISSTQSFYSKYSCLDKGCPASLKRTPQCRLIMIACI